MKFIYTTLAVLLLGASNLMASTPLVSSDWLYEKINSGDTIDNTLIIDLRNSIGNGNYEVYTEGHIPTSIHSDYSKDGWRVARDGIVGLVPTGDQFQTLVQNLGVNNNTHVVVVPAGVSSSDFGSSARVYWTFKVFGHENVSILDGGFAGWVSTYPGNVETGSFEKREIGNFKAEYNPKLYISTEEVAELIRSKSDTNLLDGRNEEQFYAKAKHGKALAAGRLPGSILISQANSYLDDQNALKPIAELKKIYSSLGEKDTVSYCNTGHWAATNWFVVSEVLGKKNTRLYDGSMVEWSNNTSLPLETSGPSNLDKLKSYL
ncbi:rhodanese-like domain-containing protein [Hyphomicrobiales bacterium]|jgi:thiosulfate/3-mercaptopyruvate sulfurtransferase|nr:rhodanese-like domain-containing protein [Hyphomicrobiales bacterium]